MILGIGNLIAQKWTPAVVEFEQWANFIDISIIFLAIIVTGIYIWYRSSYYRSVKVQNPERVFSIHRPWFNSLWSILILNVIIALILSLLILSKKSFEAIFSALGTGVLEGLIGMLIYWILSVSIPLPKRVKYVPHFWKHSQKGRA